MLSLLLLNENGGDDGTDAWYSAIKAAIISRRYRDRYVIWRCIGMGGGGGAGTVGAGQ